MKMSLYDKSPESEVVRGVLERYLVCEAARDTAEEVETTAVPLTLFTTPVGEEGERR